MATSNMDSLIPAEERKVHFCTTGPDFPYMYYISVMTALKAFGDQVILWVAQEPKSIYYDILQENTLLTIKRIPAKEIPDFPILRDKDPHFRYTNLFDYLIWRIVYDHGGILMGLDSLTLKPYWDLLESGSELFAPKDALKSNDFAMEGAIIRKGSSIAAAIIAEASTVLNGENMKWGDAGIAPYITHAKLNLDKVTVGEYGQVGKTPFDLWKDDGKLMHQDTRSFSLYERSSRASAFLTEQYISKSQSLYARLVRGILSEKEWKTSLKGEGTMPTSNFDALTKIMGLVLERKPLLESILDVGIGFGKYGFLFREYLDIWYGRYAKNDWKTRIDGIEICQEYHTPTHDFIYDEVTYGNVMDCLDILSKYDLVLLSDVIEHLSKVDGQHFLDAIEGDYIVSTPKVFCQNEMGNLPESERHLSLWEQSDFPNSEICGRKIVGWRFGQKVPEPPESRNQRHIPPEEQNVHFCTTGPDFPYMYYISVMTALKAFGDQVILWVAQETESVYFDLLKEQPFLRIECIPTEDVPDFPILRDKDPHFRYTNLFNYFIWRICYDHGGILMGLDSLTLKPYWDLIEEGKEIFAPVDETKVLHFAMEGAIVRKGSEIAKAIIADASSVLNGVAMHWGDAGIIPYIAHTKLNIEKVTLGEYGQVGRMPHDLWKDDGKLIHQDTRSFSLYERSSKASDFLSEKYVAESQSLYARLVRGLLPREEWEPNLVKSVVSQSISSTTYSGLDPTKSKRFHLLGLPHLPTNKVEGLACAYSQKVLKMSQMLKALGHTVFFYGVEGSTVECDEFIQVSTQAILKEAYGDYDYRKGTFKHDPKDIAYQTFNPAAIREIQKRMTETDYLLLAWPGSYPIYQQLGTRDPNDSSKLFLSVESGIGYNWTFTKFRVFESYAWLHHVYGLDAPVDPAIIGKPQPGSNLLSFQLQLNKRTSIDGNNYDVVIPNFFDPDDFEFNEKKGDYFLYLGRIIRRKGIHIAIETVEKIGAKLIVAGQEGGENVNLDSPYIEFVGYADHAKRKELLKNAKALFAPTCYLEPFGGVIIEAGLSGTPVITSDWGAFPENVIHGKTGFRCRNMDHYTWAARNIEQIKPADCYDFAVKNFSLERVKWMYEEYFQMLMDIKCGKGWYEEHPERRELDWLRRYYPGG